MDIGIISLLIGIIGIAIGAIITWKVADRYYKKASDDLIKEASDLRNLNILILHALENAGFAELNKDESGKPIGLNITIKPNTIKMKVSTSKPKLKIDD